MTKNKPRFNICIDRLQMQIIDISQYDQYNNKLKIQQMHTNKNINLICASQGYWKLLRRYLVKSFLKSF